MLEFNPESPALISELGCVDYYAGHYEDSIRYYRQSLAQAPQGVLANWGLGRSLAKEANLLKHSTYYVGSMPRMGWSTRSSMRGSVTLKPRSGDRVGARAMIQPLAGDVA